MNWRRYIAALVLSFLAALIFDVAWNGIALRGVFEAAAVHWRPPDELYRLIPFGWLTMFLMMAFFGLLFVRGRWSGIRGGLEFGTWLALAGAAGVVGMVSLVPWPLQLIGGMVVQQAGNGLLLGLFFGWVYRPQGVHREV